MISVRNLQRKIPVDLKQLQSFAERAFAFCQHIKRQGSDEFQEIVIVLISDERMAKLHRQFLNQPGPTDVITFQHGEIFISVSTAKRQARQFGTPTQREIELYIAHGLLHLHGFDDRTPGQRRKMRAAEAAVLDSSTV